MGFFKQFTDGIKEGMAAGAKPNTKATSNCDATPIETYQVVYKGGLREYPKQKAGAIKFLLMVDKFQLLPTIGTKSWFSELRIPYSKVVAVQLAQRTVSTFEGILGGLDSRQLNQANNIHLTFRGVTGEELVIRLEMVSGITVMGQASKCLEFMDRLKSHKILDQFEVARAKPSQGGANIPEQIEKLAELVAKGILTVEEFNLKKSELLARM